MIDRETAIKMALEAGFGTGSMDYADGQGSHRFVTSIGDNCVVEIEKLVNAAYAAGQLDMQKKASEVAENTDHLADLPDAIRAIEVHQ